MHVLFDRWPKLARLPRIELATLPTPVAPMPRTSARICADVWVKRDDVTALRYGGNKVRKLEYLLGRAKQRGADTLVTTGALGSHHVFATALYGKEHGFPTHAVLVPQYYHQHVEDQLRADLAIGARLGAVKSYPAVVRRMAGLSLGLRLRGHRPYVIPVGGSNVYGTIAYVNAGLELAEQIDAGECPDPDAVYVATGSGATVAGIALGLAAAGVRTQVVAVRVTRGFYAHRLRVSQLIRSAAARLRRLERRFPDVAARAVDSLEFDDVELGRGYGIPTPSSEAARELALLDGLVLDPTYTSKALAALLRDGEAERHNKKLLFWNTYSSAPLEPFLAGTPELPEAWVKLMRLP